MWSLIQQAIEGANGILVTTEYVRDRLVRDLIDLPLDRFLVLPCGVDFDEFQPDQGAVIARKYALPERYVICPGALTASKGPQNVVAATVEYADLAPTVFIGDGELRRQIEADLDDRGKVLGFVSAEDKAALINAARGGHVVEADLLAALDSGAVGAATLDVFDTEPLPQGHPFWAHPRVRVTPHVAAITYGDTTAREIASNIKRFRAGAPMSGLVDRRRHY